MTRSTRHTRTFGIDGRLIDGRLIDGRLIDEGEAMSDRRRPVHISDLLWLTAFVAFVIGMVFPAYRMASDAHYYAAKLPLGLLGPLAVLATFGVLLVPLSQLWIGVFIMRATGSIVTRGFGIAVLFNAIPSGFASALIATNKH